MIFLNLFEKNQKKSKKSQKSEKNKILENFKKSKFSTKIPKMDPLFAPTPQLPTSRKNIISKDFLLGFSTVNVEYDILLEKRGFGDRSVREKSLFFDSKKNVQFRQKWSAVTYTDP